MAMKGLRRLNTIRTIAIVASVVAFEIVLRLVVNAEIYRQIKFVFLRVDGLFLVFTLILYKHFADKLENTEELWKEAIREFEWKQASAFGRFVYCLAIIVWVLTGFLIGGAIAVIIDWK